MIRARATSLYYGSIGFSRAWRALWIALTSPANTAPARRAELGTAVNTALEANDTRTFAFGSARSALAAGLRAAGVGRGDEVVVSAYSCLAVPTGVIAAGATPVYCDIDPWTLNQTLDSILGVVTARTRAVVVQHTLGRVTPVADVVAALRPRGIVVIEDCALSVGSRSGDALAGSSGDAAVFSLELSKTLSSGWGGILLANDPVLAAAAASVYESVPEKRGSEARKDMLQTAISAWCHSPAVFDWLGKYALFFAFKFGWFRRSTPPAEFMGNVADDFMIRMGAPQARLAALQWRDLSRIAESCETNAMAIRAELTSLGVAAPGSPGRGDHAVSPRVSLLVSDRTRAVVFFERFGIELGRWFDGPMSPLPTAPAFNYSPGSYPNAERVAVQVVNLPCHSGVSRRGMRRMISALRRFVREHPDAVVRAAGVLP